MGWLQGPNPSPPLTVYTKLHHERSVSRGGDPAGGKVYYRKTSRLGDLLHEGEGRADLLGEHEQLVLVHALYLRQGDDTTVTTVTTAVPAPPTITAQERKNV